MQRLRRVPLAAVAWCLLLTAVAGGANAQNDRIDPALIGKNGLWTAEEREAVQAFVNQHVDSLLGGEEGPMTNARDSLIRPFETAGATELFKRQLTTMIAERLAPAMDAEQVKVRINAAVVCERFTSVDGLPLIVKGLKDASSGVRYPSGKAVSSLLRNAEVAPGQQQDVLDLLEARIDVEDDPFIVDPLLEAMLVAGGPGRTIAALNRRVDWHIARPEAGFDPERKSMFAIYERLAISPNPDPAVVREMARAAGRIFLLAAQQLNQGVVPKPIERSHVEMIKMAQLALRFAHQNLRAPQRLPGDVEQIVNFGDWGKTLGIAREWIEILGQAPYNFTPEELEVVEQQAANAAQ